ncbi:hypothetical protein HDU97_002522 [Phlyctochytrium planicorne]|nr:hypothetical protein HDU97_002522 [Phlyctochytrium planicorne]
MTSPTTPLMVTINAAMRPPMPEKVDSAVEVLDFYTPTASLTDSALILPTHVDSITKKKTPPPLPMEILKPPLYKEKLYIPQQLLVPGPQGRSIRGARKKGRARSLTCDNSPPETPLGSATSSRKPRASKFRRVFDETVTSCSKSSPVPIIFTPPTPSPLSQQDLSAYVPPPLPQESYIQGPRVTWTPSPMTPEEEDATGVNPVLASLSYTFGSAKPRQARPQQRITSQTRTAHQFGQPYSENPQFSIRTHNQDEDDLYSTRRKPRQTNEAESMNAREPDQAFPVAAEEATPMDWDTVISAAEEGYLPPVEPVPVPGLSTGWNPWMERNLETARKMASSAHDRTVGSENFSRRQPPFHQTLNPKLPIMPQHPQKMQNFYLKNTHMPQRQSPYSSPRFSGQRNVTGANQAPRPSNGQPVPAPTQPSPLSQCRSPQQPQAINEHVFQQPFPYPTTFNVPFNRNPHNPNNAHHLQPQHQQQQQHISISQPNHQSFHYAHPIPQYTQSLPTSLATSRSSSRASSYSNISTGGGVWVDDEKGWVTKRLPFLKPNTA